DLMRESPPRAPTVQARALLNQDELTEAPAKAAALSGSADSPPPRAPTVQARALLNQDELTEAPAKAAALSGSPTRLQPRDSSQLHHSVAEGGQEITLCSAIPGKTTVAALLTLCPKLPRPVEPELEKCVLVAQRWTGRCHTCWPVPSHRIGAVRHQKGNGGFPWQSAKSAATTTTRVST